MALREIRKIGDEILRKKSRRVDIIDDRVKILLQDMVETMHIADGVGLAAVQVGVLKRIIVIDLGNEMGILKIVNPEIIESEGIQITSEGCLSVPDVRGEVIRPQSLTFKGLNENGEEISYKAEGLFAKVASHEIDHLDGILFVDKLEKEE
jgi:peptide deformylase